ncbi:unnamed protein product, partial [Effrenium voratum]
PIFRRQQLLLVPQLQRHGAEHAPGERPNVPAHGPPAGGGLRRAGLALQHALHGGQQPWRGPDRFPGDPKDQGAAGGHEPAHEADEEDVPSDGRLAANAFLGP